MRRSIIFICFFFGLFFEGYCQTVPKDIKTLNIGDTIPDMVITHFLNGKEQKEKISKLYKHGGLIINFWATWCIPCIRELPRLDSLQREYRSHLNIVCFTYQDSTNVSTFFDQHTQLKPDYLSIVTNDTFLYKVFPHRVIPHNVWIDENGIIRAITGDEDINEKNIASIISGGDLKFTLKADDMTFTYKEPLVVKNNKFVDRSIITGYRPDIGNGGIYTQWDSTHSLIKRWLCWNGKVTDFIWHSYYPMLSVVNFNLIELHVADSSRFLSYSHIKDISTGTRYQNERQWRDANIYCYELCFSKGIKKNLFYSYIKQDIERYFNIVTQIKYKEIPCWVVTGEPDRDVLKKTRSQKGWLQLIGNGKDSATLIVRHKTLNEIFSFFLNRANYDPYVNKTNIDYPVDISLQFTHLTGGAVSIDLLKQKLEQYGLMFKKEVQPYPVLVISDKQ